MADTVHPEVAFLDALHAALEHIDGSAPYSYAVTVARHNGLPLEVGDPPLVCIGDPTVSAGRPGGSMLGEDYLMDVPVVMVVVAEDETQRARVAASMTALHDLRRAIRRRVDGYWLGVSVPLCLVDLQIVDAIAQPEADPDTSAWYGVARVTVQMRYHVRYPAVEG